MYVPASFRVDEQDRITEFLQQHPFATMVTHNGQAPFASHLPMLYEPGDQGRGKIVSHMARANPQWQHLVDGQEVLTVFSGPHAYVSPSWYQATEAVPTWNYTAVHVYGTATLVTDHASMVKMLEKTVATFESSMSDPWSGEISTELRDSLLESIVGFEISISRVEAKFKLSQNRPVEDAQGVVESLRLSASTTDRELAEMMQQELALRDA